MTIKNAGSPLSMSEISTEVGVAANSERKLGFTSSRKLAGSPRIVETRPVYLDNLGVQWPLSSFIVPANVTEITFSMVIGGGGGGGGYIGGGGNSDTHSGGAGGAGAFVSNAVMSVQEGDVIGITVGRGGTSASVQYYNGTWLYIGTAGTAGAYHQGGNGGDTVITRNGALFINARGGWGGTAGGPGDNCSGTSGTGGAPMMAGFMGNPTYGNGAAGGAVNCNRNSFTKTLGGAGTAMVMEPGFIGPVPTYGGGGNSWSSGVGADSGPTTGSDGIVQYTYTIAGVPVSGQISMSQFYGKTKTY